MATTQGKWLIKNLKHTQQYGGRAVSIPIRLYYRGGNPVDVTITNTAINKDTEWYTNIVDGEGVSINPSDITYSGGTVTCGDTIYKVTEPSTWNWTIVPVHGGGGDDPTLTLTYSGGNISYNGGQATVSIRSNTGWTITSNQSWAALSTTSGNGDRDITVTFSSNSGSQSPRTVTLTAKTGDGSIIRTLEITQNAEPAPTPTLTISASPQSGVPATGGSSTITVRSNTGWTLSISSDAREYCSLSITSGSDTGTSILTFSENDSTASRSATITATYGNNQTRQVTVTQSGAGLSLTISIEPSSFTYEGGTATITITSNTSWTLSLDQDTITGGWAAIVGSASGSGNATRELTLYPNSVIDDHTIYVTATYGNNQTATDSVTVAGYVPPGEEDHYIELTPSTTSITSDGHVQIVAEYVTTIDGVETHRETVTTTANWDITTGGDYATVTAGYVQGTNTGITEQEVVIRVQYGNKTATAHVTVQGVEPYARFKTTQNTTNKNAGNVTGFTVEANVPWWILGVYKQCDSDQISDWLSGNGSGGPTEGTQINLVKDENLTVSERTACVRISVGGVVTDTHIITQDRGMSDIVINGTAVSPIPYEEQTLNMTVTSNQRWKVTSMAGLTPYGGWSSGQTFDAATGYTLSVTVPRNSGGERNFSVTVTTVDSASYVDSDTYEFSQAGEPVQNGWLRFSETGGSDSGTRHLEYKHDGTSDGNAKTARAQRFTFYVKTNTMCISAITQGLKIYDSHGNDISGGRTASQFFGPTVNNDWEPFEAEIPANTTIGHIQGLREWNFTAATIDQQSFDFNWHDSARMDIEQFGNAFYMEDPFWEPDFYGYDLTEYDLESRSYIYVVDQSRTTDFRPGVLLKARYYDDAQTIDEIRDISEDQQYGILVPGGLSPRISVQYPSWFYGKEPTYNEAGGESSWVPYKDNGLTYPYAFNIPANQDWCPRTGQSREGDIVISYSFGGYNIPFNIHVTQPYECVPAPELGLDLYVATTEGGQGAAVKEDTVRVKNVGNEKQIVFSFVSGSLASGDAKYYISSTDEGPASSCFSKGTFGIEGWVYDNIDGHFMNPTVNIWPGHSVDCILVLKDDITDDFTVTITGVKSDDGMVTTTLTLHVSLT